MGDVYERVCGAVKGWEWEWYKRWDGARGLVASWRDGRSWWTGPGA